MILSVRLHVDLSLSKGYTGARCNWPIFNPGAPEAEHTGSNKGKGQAATQPSHCLGVRQVSLLADEGGQPSSSSSSSSSSSLNKNNNDQQRVKNRQQ